MEKPILKNPDEFPDDDVLQRTLGPAKPAWDEFNKILEQEFPDALGEWRFYKDGFAWLFKVVK